MISKCLYSCDIKHSLKYPEEYDKCSTCTINTHILIFIQHIYTTAYKTEKVFDYLTHNDIKIRHLSILYIIKYYSIYLIPSQLYNDPSHKIRSLFVNVLDSSNLIKWLDDSNELVLVKVLEVIYQRHCKNKEIYEMTSSNLNINWLIKKINSVQKEIEKSVDDMFDMPLLCEKITKLSTHPYKQIRILISKLFSMFSYSNKDIVKCMLLKDISNDMSGGIVYGLEDESSEIRKNTIISLYQIYCNLVKDGKQ